DGLLQPGFGISELSRGGANRGEPLQDVVAQWIIPGCLLGEFEGAREGREGGFIISLQVRGVTGFEERRNAGRIVLGEDAVYQAGGKEGKGEGSSANKRRHTGFIVLIN